MDKSILFITNDFNLNRGSYRIWVNDLNHYFKYLKINSAINDESIDSYDIVIIDKNSTNYYDKVKEKYPNKKVGIINLSKDSKLKPDFVIAGSIEEMDSLSHHKNVFLFPLIENMFQNIRLKNHKNTETMTICYHGNVYHLNAFSLGLKNALESFHNDIPIKLRVITESDQPNWIDGKPNVPIEFIKYNLDTIIGDILDSDIGIVPNINDIPTISKINNNTGLIPSDYLVRFKNKSNAGRAFVFHQLGIPVVADLTPSHLHILGNPQNGFAVLNEKGWIKAFSKLKNSKFRQEISINAKSEFDRLYNPIKWANNLYNNIKKINV